VSIEKPFHTLLGSKVCLGKLGIRKPTDKGGKGKQMATVRVRRLGEAPVRITLEDGATVQDALEKAGISASSGTVWMNGDTALMDTQVRDGDTIIIQPDVKLG